MFFLSDTGIFDKFCGGMKACRRSEYILFLIQIFCLLFAVFGFVFDESVHLGL